MADAEGAEWQLLLAVQPNRSIGANQVISKIGYGGEFAIRQSSEHRAETRKLPLLTASECIVSGDED